MPSVTIASLSADFNKHVAAVGDNFKELKSLITTQNKEMAILKKTIESLVSDRAQLEAQVKTLQQESKSAKSLIDDQDQYERKDSIILSGPAIPNMVTDENTHEIMKKLVKDNFGTNTQDADINITHRLGPIRKSSNGSPNPKRNIYIEFVRRDIKRKVIIASKTNRNTQLYANESLTPYRRRIFHALRRMKKHVDTVKGCSTMDGRIYAFTAPLPNQTRDQRHHIKDMDALHDFCRQYVKQPIDSFLDNFGDSTPN